MMERTEWNKFQEAETDFWEDFAKGSSHFSREYWCQEMDKYHGSISVSDFERRNVLEVGCGPKGMVHYVAGETKVGVDPLIRSYVRLGILEEGRVEHVVGVGEELPLADESFDIAICFNVLDHSATPSRVAGEVHRVLRKGGRLMFHCHCLASVAKPVRGLVRNFDRRHPWHLTAAEVKGILRGANLMEEYGRTAPFSWKARSLVRHLAAKALVRDYFAVYVKPEVSL